MNKIDRMGAKMRAAHCNSLLGESAERLVSILFIRSILSIRQLGPAGGRGVGAVAVRANVNSVRSKVNSGVRANVNTAGLEGLEEAGA